MQFDMNELKKERTEFKEKATNIGHEMQKVCLSHMCRLQRYTRDQEVPSSVLTHCAVEYGPWQWVSRSRTFASVAKQLLFWY